MQFAIPIESSPRTSVKPNRLHGLDTLRGVAAVLVVLLHAGIPYMTKPLAFLVWPARDIHPCWAVDGLTWCTECFLMPLFFVLAGFFSNGLLISRGERIFLAGRTKRLLSTQLAANLAILPVCLAVWLLGFAAEGIYDPMKCNLPPELKAGLFGVAHLWFLQNLYIYCVILCGISWLSKRTGRSQPNHPDCGQRFYRSLNDALLSVWKPLLPAIPCAFILYLDTRIVLGFYQSFTPVVSKLAYYSIYFFVGALLYRQRDQLYLHARFGKTYLLIASTIFIAGLPLIHEHSTAALAGPRLALLSGILSLFAWFTTLGLFAIFLGTARRENAVTRYLAEASFWIYLIHLPFVTLTHIAVAESSIPAMGKFLITGLTAMALSLMTYHVFVRETWLGEFLGGHRRLSPFQTLLQDPLLSRRSRPMQWHTRSALASKSV